jgi:hypothetical protein
MIDQKPYSVTTWGSHPDEDNDDCWTGEGYDTLAEARAAFETDLHDLFALWTTDLHVKRLAELSDRAASAEEIHMVRMGLLVQNAEDVRSTAYIMLDGPDVNEIRKNPHFKARSRKADDDAWRREQAMEAGMLHGCDAYNDVLEQG